MKINSIDIILWKKADITIDILTLIQSLIFQVVVLMACLRSQPAATSWGAIQITKAHNMKVLSSCSVYVSRELSPTWLQLQAVSLSAIKYDAVHNNEN